ncbi:MAG: RsmB/NOP family class I SAM-dependent RNA methyltransferase [Dichotomicrobium sp.]
MSQSRQRRRASRGADLSPSAPAGYATRNACARILRQTLVKHQPLDDALTLLDRSDAAPLAPNDRAFVRAMVGTVLRRKGQIDDALARFIESPLPDRRGLLDEILLTAGAQLLFMDTPAHAVINIAVEQARRDHSARRFASLANAVLRRIASARAEILSAQDSAKLNTPEWLWTRWTAHFGEDTARAIAAQHLLEPPLDLSVTSDPEGWAERLGGMVLPTGSVRLAARGRIEALPGYDEGGWWVQDAAAALPARVLGDIHGRRVADLCAAPGGKTAQLAIAGGRVTAVDQSPKRIARLETNLERLGLTAETVTADAAAWRPDEPFDAVLLDAPCTATGTIRRHPDIPHLKRPDDLDKLADLQSRLLDNAATLIRPGGALVYCTCSLEPEEGGEQIERLLERHAGLEREPITPDAIGARPDWIRPPGVIRTLPHQMPADDPVLSGIDGFFVAKLLKFGG